MREVNRETLLEKIADLELLKESGAISLHGEYNLTVYKMLLATMGAEPVAEVYQVPNVGICAALGPSIRMLCPLEPGTKLYPHAQPAPVVPAVSDDIGDIHVGRLPTMNQDDYPGLGDWWVQLRIGEDFDEVLARVYGATPQEANNRAEALARRSAMLNK